MKEEFTHINSIGSSSSVSGTGPIDTIDPILNKKKLRRIIPKKKVEDNGQHTNKSNRNSNR